MRAQCQKVGGSFVRVNHAEVGCGCRIRESVNCNIPRRRKMYTRPVNMSAVTILVFLMKGKKQQFQEL